MAAGPWPAQKPNGGRLFGDRARGDSESETGRYLDLSVRYHQGDRNFSQTTACGKSDRGKRRKSERSDPVCQVTSEVSIRQQSIVLKLVSKFQVFRLERVVLGAKADPLS